MRTYRYLAALLVGLAALAGLSLPAQARSTTYTQLSLTATVSGASVTATASVKASVLTNVDDYGIGISPAPAGQDIAWLPNKDITTSGTSITGTLGGLAPGTYTYYVYVNDPATGINWLTVGSSKTFVVAGCSGTVPCGKSGTWTQTFTDDFTGTSVSTTKWNPAYSGTMNNVTILAANTTVSGGIATLTLAPKAGGGYTGAMLNSGPADGRPGGTTPYSLPVGGFAEAKVSFPANSSGQCVNWPAWWTSGENWPTNGEHDIAEVLAGLSINYHYGTDYGAGHHQLGAITPSGSWCGSGYHTYGVYRGSSTAEVYWDGVLKRTYATDDLGGGQSLILNIGTSGTVDTSKKLLVDYVRAWQ